MIESAWTIDDAFAAFKDHLEAKVQDPDDYGNAGPRCLDVPCEGFQRPRRLRDREGLRDTEARPYHHGGIRSQRHNGDGLY